MFFRHAPPRQPPPYVQQAPSQVPQYYNHHYNYRGLDGANRFPVPNQVRLSPYKWTPPSPAVPVVPPHTPRMNKGRKRQNNECNPHAMKRQRLDSFSHPSSSPIWATQPPRYPDPAVAESLRSSLVGFNQSFSGPNVYHQPQWLPVPESSVSLQFYAKDKLSSQMVELFEACQQQPSDLEQKEAFRAHLQQDIQRVYSVARLYLTGSSMNGLACRSSDADLCLVINQIKKRDAINILSKLNTVFKSLTYVDRIQLIRAKVPILKFREKGSDLEFDLNVNNTVGIRNTFLLKGYAYADLRIRPLILVVKKWARHHKINDASKGTLSSYTLVLMVLHYLQTLKEPVLPSLQKDYPYCFDPFVDVDSVPERSKSIPPYISRNQSPLGELFLGFLRYYTTQFSWNKHVISVREATALPKNNSQEWKNKFICVEEPFERKNVARAVHEKTKFDAIKDQFAESSRILHSKKDLNSILPFRTIITQESSRK